MKVAPDDHGSQSTLPPSRGKGWGRGLLILPAFVVISLIMQGFGLSLLHFLFDVPKEALLEMGIRSLPLSHFIVLQTCTLIGTLFITSLFRQYLDRRSFVSMGFSTANFSSNFSRGSLTGFFIIAAGFSILWASGFLQVRTMAFPAGTLLLQLFLLLLVSLNEEILIRGYLLNNLLRSWSIPLSLGVSAAAFMMLHSFNPGLNAVALINIFLAGILLGIEYTRTRDLWYPIALHWSWNLFQGPVFGFEVSGIDLQKAIIGQSLSGHRLLTGGPFGFEGSLLLTFLLALVITIKAIRMKKVAPAGGSS